jgi:hypothetical protein
MVTGPRETPHPIILHVDDQGNPVRLAEASAIYVTTVSALNISATNYLGLSLTGVAVPQGESTEIQFRRNSTQLGGDASLTFDEVNQRLNANEILVGNFSSTNDAFFEELIRAPGGLSSTTLSSINSTIQTLSATTISAITVCATNYNSLFNSLSFQNLDARYLNSSGDSVTGSFTVQSLSATTISATNWRGLPSALATWNASSIQGIPVTSTAPSPFQTLIYRDGFWQPSSVAGVAGGVPGGNSLTIQFNNGIFSGVDSVKYSESISGLSLTTLSSTNLSSVNVRVTTISATTYNNLQEGTAKWNANKISDVSVIKPTTKSYKDILAIDAGGNSFEKVGIAQYGGWVYDEIKSTIHSELPQTNASALRGFTVTSTTPSANNVLIYTGSTWAPSSAISLNTISATNWRGLPSSLSIWNATSANGYRLDLADEVGAPPSFGYILSIGVGGNSVQAYSPALVGGPFGLSPYVKNANGSPGYVQFAGPGGALSGDVNLTYTKSTGILTASTISLPSGSIFLAAPEYPTYISNQGINTRYLQVLPGGSIVGPSVSATTYSIFNKQTSSTPVIPSPTRDNQTITYDEGANVWKPGYTIYQATGTPNSALGSNGDIYFRYIP